MAHAMLVSTWCIHIRGGGGTCTACSEISVRPPGATLLWVLRMSPRRFIHRCLAQMRYRIWHCRLRTAWLPGSTRSRARARTTANRQPRARRPPAFAFAAVRSPHPAVKYSGATSTCKLWLFVLLLLVVVGGGRLWVAGAAVGGVGGWLIGHFQ